MNFNLQFHGEWPKYPWMEMVLFLVQLDSSEVISFLLLCLMQFSSSPMPLSEKILNGNKASNSVSAHPPPASKNFSSV